MEGDQLDVPAWCNLAEEHNANLYIDEAHATGVLGQNGMGLTVGQKGVAMSMGTFGKGCGSFGAYVACTESMRDYLINFCPGIIYTTALPPPVVGAIDAALDLIPTMDRQRAALLSLADDLRNKIRQLGFDTGTSSTHIIPVIAGGEQQAISLARYLEENSIFAPAIRPPTVPPNTARVRFSLSLAHERGHIDRLISLFEPMEMNGVEILLATWLGLIFLLALMDIEPGGLV